MKEIYEMKGAGRSIRGIAGELGIARNTVRRYLKSPEAMRPKPRPSRGSKLDAYTEYVDRRMSEGLENCVVLHRELKALGYDGGYSILKSYVSPRRPRRQPDATMRFETAPGEQAQVDWGTIMPVAREKFGACGVGCGVWGVDDGEEVQGTAGGGGATGANGVGVQGAGGGL